MMNPEAGAHSSSDKRGHTAFIRLNICAFHDHGDPDERDKKGLAFNYEGLKDFLGSKSIPLSRVRNMKIRKGKFLVITDSEQVFPLNDIDQYRNGSCTVCTDLTAEKADLSFGGVGSKEGYTTVLARTGLGLELFRDAGDRGYLKIEPLEKEALEKVLHQAKAKKVQMYMIKKRFETMASL